jgi:dolichol-phosphate mannosyltransferase
MQELALVDGGRTQGRALLPVPAGALAVAEGADPEVRLSLVIPTFNEGKNVRELVERLTELLEPELGDAYELIVVDDDSPDRTWEIAAGLLGGHPRLRVMRRQGERGLATAVIRGWQAARGEVLAVIDADLQHPPEATLSLWKEIERGVDLAVASRHVAGGGVSDWALHRRVVSRGAQALGLVLLPGVLRRVSDPMSGYFMVRRSAVAGRAMSPLGYKILVEVIGRGEIHSIGEVGYVFRERAEGESKVTFRLYVEYLRHLVRLRLDTLPLARFARFCVVGASGVLVDMGVFYLLGDPSGLHIGLTPSKAIAAECAIASNFLWNDAWTFRDAAGRQPGASAKLGRFARFSLVCSIGLVINLLLLDALVLVFGVNRYVANAVAIAVVSLWNYGLNARLSWRVPRAR